TEGAGAVVMDTSLKRVDELFHIARRMRRIALQSAVGGMALSVVGMFIAFGGRAAPVGGGRFPEGLGSGGGRYSRLCAPPFPGASSATTELLAAHAAGVVDVTSNHSEHGRCHAARRP